MPRLVRPPPRAALTSSTPPGPAAGAPRRLRAEGRRFEVSDEQLRALERRWEASRDPADEERLLAARLRAGELPRARLELAARGGHGPARAALGGPGPLEPAAAQELAAALDPAGRRALVRLALHLFARSRGALEGAARQELGPVHGALELWCCDLGAGADAAALLRLRRARDLLSEARWIAPFLVPPAPQRLALIERCLELAATDTERALARALLALEPAFAPDAPDSAGGAAGAELIEWALGPAHAPARAQERSGAPGAAACHTE